MGLFNFLRKKETDVEQYRQELNTRRSAQASAAAEPSQPGGSTLLQVDDVFSITGRGTVVVGKCTAPFGVQERVLIFNPDGSKRESVVTGLEKFRAKIEFVTPGENVGVLLRGVSRQEIAPGAYLRKL